MKTELKCTIQEDDICISTMISGMVNSHYKEIVRTKDKMVREGLKWLGWATPEEATELRKLDSLHSDERDRDLELLREKDAEISGLRFDVEVWRRMFNSSSLEHCKLKLSIKNQPERTTKEEF